MSATFAAGASVHALRSRFAWPDLTEEHDVWFLTTWRFGKWYLVFYQLVLVRMKQLFPWMLAAVARGTAATASFQAGLNIASMMNPIIFGIGNAIPQIAAHAHRSERRARRVTRGVSLCALRAGPNSCHLRRRSADA